MLRFLMSALKAAWSAALWVLGMTLDFITLPLRMFTPPSGRSAIPHAPSSVSVEPSGPVVRPMPVMTSASPTREAALVIRHLSTRLRAGQAAAGAPSTEISPTIRNWVNALDDDQARRAVKAGIQGYLHTCPDGRSSTDCL